MPDNKSATSQENYVFNRYPVLKIQATMATHIAMNTTVIIRLIGTLTSAMP
jgi:hypothetical protein